MIRIHQRRHKQQDKEHSKNHMIELELMRKRRRQRRSKRSSIRKHKQGNYMQLQGRHQITMSKRRRRRRRKHESDWIRQKRRRKTDQKNTGKKRRKTEDDEQLGQAVREGVLFSHSKLAYGCGLRWTKVPCSPGSHPTSDIKWPLVKLLDVQLPCASDWLDISAVSEWQNVADLQAERSTAPGGFIAPSRDDPWRWIKAVWPPFSGDGGGFQRRKPRKRTRTPTKTNSWGKQTNKPIHELKRIEVYISLLSLLRLLLMLLPQLIPYFDSMKHWMNEHAVYQTKEWMSKWMDTWID